MKANLQIANLLSWSRILATPVVMLLLFLQDWQPAYILAAIVFVIAQVTDILDGYLARRQKMVSNLGIFLDLTADKLFTAGVLVMMVEQRIISAWLVAIILGREFLITGVRTYAATFGVVIPAGKWGKRKTVLTGVSLTWLMVWFDAAVRPNGLLRDVNDWILFGDFQPFKWFFLFGWVLTYLMVAITIFSGWLYLRDAAYLFSDKPNVNPTGKPDSSPAQVSPTEESAGTVTSSRQ